VISFLLGIVNLAFAATSVAAGNYGTAVFNFGVFLLMLALYVVDQWQDHARGGE
jgi:hypothetical protein